MAEDLLGTTVGHIRIVERLAKGGIGEVYVGFDEQLQRKVAVKAIRDELRLDPEAKARLLREARILSRLEHPNICRIYDYVSAEAGDFLVLELIEGKNLRQALARTSPTAARCASPWRSPACSTRPTARGSSTATSSPTT